MKVDIENLFKYSICISCKPERYEVLKKAFMFANLPFPALMETDRYKRAGGSFRIGLKAAYDDYAKAVSAAHAKAIQHAADGKWPRVLMFEDDAWPRKDARSWIENIISEVN